MFNRTNAQRSLIFMIMVTSTVILEPINCDVTKKIFWSCTSMI